MALTPFKFYSQNDTPLHVVSTFLHFIRRSISAIGAQDDIAAAIVFDIPTASENHLLLDEYKANRIKDYSQMEDHPFIHLPYIQEALAYVDIPIFEIDGIEADDVIATIRHRFLEEYPSGNVYIVSTDSDFFQLLDDHTYIVKHLQQGKSIILRKEMVEQELGIPIEQYVYFKSLVGDKADNIKGVNGIGKVRASKIIQGKFPFDPALYTDVLTRNKKLITLNHACDIPVALDTLTIGSILQMSNEEIFTGCAF